MSFNHDQWKIETCTFDKKELVYQKKKDKKELCKKIIEKISVIIPMW